MTISRVGSVTFQSSSSNNTGFTFNHPTVSGQSLLLLTLHLEAGETVTGTPTFDGGDFTLIAAGTAGANSDTRSWLWGIVNPNLGNLEIVIAFSSANPSFVAAFNYDGTQTVSVAAAVNLIEEVQNTSGTTTTVFASAGAANDNWLWSSYVFQGNDGRPISVSSGWNEVYDLETGTSASSDFSTGAAEEPSPPNSLTVTWSTDDENSGMLVELINFIPRRIFNTS